MKTFEKEVHFLIYQQINFFTIINHKKYLVF